MGFIHVAQTGTAWAYGARDEVCGEHARKWGRQIKSQMPIKIKRQLNCLLWMYFLTKAKSSTLIKRFLDGSYCCTWLSTSAPPTWPGTRYLRRYIFLQLFLKFTSLYLLIHQYKALIALVDNTRIHISLSICIVIYIFTNIFIIYLHISY